MDARRLYTLIVLLVFWLTTVGLVRVLLAPIRDAFICFGRRCVMRIHCCARKSVAVPSGLPVDGGCA